MADLGLGGLAKLPIHPTIFNALLEVLLPLFLKKIVGFSGVTFVLSVGFALHCCPFGAVALLPGMVALVLLSLQSPPPRWDWRSCWAGIFHNEALCPLGAHRTGHGVRG